MSVEGDESFVTGVYQGNIKPTLGAGLKTNFKPWHKPRKHFLRLNQWCAHAKLLIESQNLSINGELRYLGLPGEDLLDIRVLQQLCQQNDMLLRYIGFDTSLMSQDLSLSRHAINSSGFIHRASVVLGDSLDNIVSHTHPSYSLVDQNAPYDIINLDFCGSITRRDKEGVLSNLESIKKLCDIQRKRSTRKWILFLTSRGLRADLKREDIEQLYCQVIANIDHGGGFPEALAADLKIDIDILRREAEAPWGAMDVDQWASSYVLAVSKWLLSYLTSAGGIEIKLLESYFYNVGPQGKDMISLSFSIEPTGVVLTDSSGLTVANPITMPSIPSESDMACALVTQISNMRDVDETLSSDTTLFDKMVKKSGELLRPLGYDIEAYGKYALETYE